MARHADAAASFAQGIRAMTPLFQKMPMAFAQITGQLSRDYLQAIEQAHLEIDEKLLAPVVEVLDKLKQNPPSP
jgi:hypothetical protein